MKWLEKHWIWLVAIPVVGFVAYWLYQAYQSNSANNAANAQNSQLQNLEQQDEAQYAQQIALASLGGQSTSPATGDTSTTVSPSTQTSATTSNAASNSPIVTGNTGLPAGTTMSEAEQNIVGNLEQNYPVGSSTPESDPSSYTAYPPTTNSSPSPVSPVTQYNGPSVVSTLFGSGGSSNDTAPAPIQGQTTLSRSNIMMNHIGDGSIPQHGTAIPKSPTVLEASSLGR